MDYTDLVDRARKGEHAAFAELYHKLYAPLFRFVYLRVKDRDVAEDVTQDTFLKFLTALPTFTGSAPLPFLHTVARNAIIDFHRKKKPDLDDDALWDLASDAPTQEEVASLGEDVAGVIRALAKLSPGEEAVVRLKYLDGLDTKEIALYLEKTEDSVRQLLSRGLSHVRSLLDGTYE